MCVEGICKIVCPNVRCKHRWHGQVQICGTKVQGASVRCKHRWHGQVQLCGTKVQGASTRHKTRDWKYMVEKYRAQVHGTQIWAVNTLYKNTG